MSEQETNLLSPKGENSEGYQPSVVYSYPGCTNYNRTVVDLWQDDQWFCSEAEALKAGYTRSGDCQNKLKGLN